MLAEPLIDLAPFQNRRNFGVFLNGRNLMSLAVELGTHRGDFASMLLSTWPGHLVCCDPWRSVAGYEDQAEGLKQLWKTTGDRMDDYLYCTKRLHRYNHRLTFKRLTSQAYAQEFYQQPANIVDFVYLDADHRYEMVKADLELWWPLIKGGGILAGHDILCANHPHGGWGQHIQPAVFDFARQRNLTVCLVMEEDNSPWSYYLEKPK